MLYSLDARLVDDCIKRNQDSIQCRAMLDVPDANHFEVRFTDVRYDCSIGIAPREVARTLAYLSSASEMPNGLYEWFDLNGAFSLYMEEMDLNPGCVPIGTPDEPVTVIKLRDIDGALANDSNSWSASNSRFTSQIKPTVEYRPIIWVDFDSTEDDALLCKFSVSLKRRCADHRLANQHKRLWIDRPFTDAIVVCDQEQFLVHRVVLSVASPVFERAFSGSMKEGSTGTFEIRSHPRDAVEAMLEFVYTGDLTEQILVSSELASLLDLAVQYG